MRPTFPAEPAALDRVVRATAYAIGKVIAKKTLASDPQLRKLDALGQASAAHTMAERMVPELHDEALAAMSCVLAHRSLFAPWPTKGPPSEGGDDAEAA